MTTVIQLTKQDGRKFLWNANTLFQTETITFLENDKQRTGTKITPYLPHFTPFTVKETEEEIRDRIRAEVQLLNGIKPDL